MKKTFKMLGMACLVGAFAFLGSSCKKEKTDTNSIRVALPTVEEEVIDGDRAYIDFSDNTMRWTKDDQLMVYNLNKADYTKSVRNVYTLYNGDGQTEGDFNGAVMGDDFGTDSDGIYAFYPASKVIGERVGPRNSETFQVLGEQTYNPGTMDPTSLVMAAKTGYNGADVIAGSYRMKHIFGFVKLNLTGNRVVNSIEIIDNAFNLSGDITIDLPKVDPVELSSMCNLLAGTSTYSTVWEQINPMLEEMNYSSNGDGKTMTLTCEEPVQLTSTPTPFIITLRPGALHKGFQVKVNYEGGSYTINKYNPNHPEYGYVGNAQLPRKFCVKPGVITTFSYAIP
jgi:hypothetical protein